MMHIYIRFMDGYVRRFIHGFVHRGQRVDANELMTNSMTIMV